MIMKYIYVAGPYTGGDPVINTRKAIEAGELLRGMGFVPFIPHLSMIWHLVEPHDVAFWYEYDNAWVERCDGLIRLPGESKGADAEVKLALELGMPVFEIVHIDGHATLQRVEEFYDKEDPEVQILEMELLQSIEWVPAWENQNRKLNFCPLCRHQRHFGHGDGCYHKETK